MTNIQEGGTHPSRPLPTVIGPTENALRALLVQALARSPIKSYRAWVVLNAASAADPGASLGKWRHGVSGALKVAPDEVDSVIAQLAADGLVHADGSLAPRGSVDLQTARATIAATTAHLVDGLSEADQTTALQVLDHVRRAAEELLTNSP